MSDEAVEQLRGRRQTVSLANLFLDPNNYRIVDHSDYRKVALEDVFNADVQRRTTALILGRSQEYVQDLIASIKENGWLDIDPILVQGRDKGRFLVVEGNRRVATLKYLQRRYEENAIDLGRLDSTVFSKVPVVIYGDADERQRMVMAGLHHITGKRRWPAVNRAMAMRRLQEYFDNDTDAVCRALGITKREFNLSVRTLALVDSYKASDYGDQFRSEQYNLFREVINSPALRNWIGWDNATCSATNDSNLERMFRWMSREPEPDEIDAEDPHVQQESDAVITTVGHVRELGKLSGDREALDRLDETRSLQEATLSSSLLVKNEIGRAFGSCDNGVQQLNRKIGDLDDEHLDRVDQLIGQLQGIALARKRQPPVVGERLPWQPFNEITHSQFSNITVHSYRGIDGVTLEDLRRVNLVVGLNNAGKTSILEAIYLLAHQNDERALLDVIRWRSRMEGEPDPVWLVEQLPPAVRISGRFDKTQSNEANVGIKLVHEPGEDIQDQTSFLSKLGIDSSYGGHIQNTEVIFFGDRSRRTEFHGQHWLCRSAFTSPFSANRPNMLAHANKESLEAGTKGKIIDFIKENVDPKLQNIELADKFSRFLVTHLGFDKAPDLSSFGDGVRRVFEIGLLFAGAQGGVLLIDEFENAIHTELLVAFTRIVQQLADELNVQVFLTTHSKEMIDALIQNEYRTEDVVGYALCQTDDSAKVKRYDGKKLLRLHEAVDFDLRRIR